jgi:hypothetical protein
VIARAKCAVQGQCGPISSEGRCPTTPAVLARTAPFSRRDRRRGNRRRGYVQHLDDRLSEILTDPSYSRQISDAHESAHRQHRCNSGDLESASFDAGLVIRELPLHSSWRGMESLAEFLTRGNVVAIAGSTRGA